MSLRETSTTQPANTTVITGVKAAPPPDVPEKMTIHVVQAGDTYGALASRYLGSVRHVHLIEKANPKINPNRLYVGTKLKIPPAPPGATPASGAAASAAASTSAKPKTPPPPIDPARAYTVKPGESWTSLTRQYLGDDNWTVLYEHNKERVPRDLRAGMVIEIPTKDELSSKK